MFTNNFAMFNYKFMFLLSLFGFISACDFNIKVRQELWLEGFHRNMTYTITFAPPFSDVRPYINCTVGIHQSLPFGIYANPDELNDLRRSHKVSAITKKTNIELPAELSDPVTVYITKKITSSTVETWVPLHARYHKVSTYGGYALNEIDAPYLYMRCPDTRLDNCMTLRPAKFVCSAYSKEKCNWKAVPFAMETLSPVEWTVPIGNLLHYYPVAIVTGLAVTLGSIYILYALHQYKNNNRE